MIKQNMNEQIIGNALTTQQMREMIEQIKNVKENSKKISIMKDKYYLFCPSSFTNNDHLFIHALYNAMEVMHERPSVSKDEMIKCLEKRNINNSFDIDVIKQIFNDF